jgi:arginase
MITSDWYLVGAPWDCSGTGRGEQQAPGVLRRAGLSALVAADFGDAATRIGSTARDPATGVRALPETVAATRELARTLDAAARRHPGMRPLVVGGDCSLLFGVFAHLREPAGLCYVDGHPDYGTGHTSETGETADLDLAVLTGDGPAELAGAGPLVAVERVALIGHRTEGLDPESAAELGRVPAEMFTVGAPEVLRDPGRAGRAVAEWGSALGVPLWLHLDVDVLDPGALPAVTYPQPGGPDFDQLAALLAPVAAAPRLIGLSVADFRPDLDPGGRYAALLVDLVGGLLAEARK